MRSRAFSNARPRSRPSALENADSSTFDQVYVDADLGTVAWPGGADIDPDVLYSAATGQPLPDFRPQWAID